MKDAFDVTEDIISLINTEEVNNLLTGAIYAFFRPDNSKDVDIVVNLITVTNQWMQQAVGSINIYAPLLPSGNPDTITLLGLANIIQPLIDTQYRSEFNTYIEKQGSLKRDLDGKWFVNIRYKYYSIQNNFKSV